MKPPKQKARELVEEFKGLKINYLYIDSQDGDCLGTGNMLSKSAKQCTIIAVDEIIEILCADSSTVGEIEFTLYNKETGGYDNIKITQLIKYYREVKQEIEML